MRACQRQLDWRHKIIIYDESSSTASHLLDNNSFVDIVVGHLADCCITTALLDGNDFLLFATACFFLLACFRTTQYRP